MKDPLLVALKLTNGTLDFGDTSFSKIESGIIFLIISIIGFIGTFGYLYKMACNRVWEPTPRAELYKTKKLYQYEDDKRMKIKRKP